MRGMFRHDNESKKGLVLKRNLRQGSVGDDVKALQQRLDGLGFPPGTADGIFGILTEEALKEFQKAYNLRPDGIAGRRVRELLADPRLPKLRRVHWVERGETITKIAADYSTTEEALLSSNRMVKGKPLYPGEAVYIDRRLVCGYVGVDREGVPAEFDWGVRRGLSLCCYPIYTLGKDGALVELKRLLSGEGKDPVFAGLSHGGGALRFCSLTNLGVIAGYRGDTGFDEVHEFLRNRKHVRTAVETLVDKVRRGGFSGVSIDLDGVDEIDRRLFTSFVSALARRLKPLNARLMVSVSACGILGRTDFERGHDTGDGRGIQGFDDEVGREYDAAAGRGYDAALLGDIADYLVIRAYCGDIAEREPGPVVDVDILRKAIRRAMESVPAWKLILGLPSIGVDWAERENRKGRLLNFREIERIGEKCVVFDDWDEKARARCKKYRYKGVKHLLWCEDAETWRERLALVTRHGMLGLMIYSLGYEDMGIWDMLPRCFAPMPASEIF